MKPTPGQVEAVARAIYETANPEAPEWSSAECRRSWGYWIDTAYECARAAIAVMNAEPLTSTPEPSTTETGTEGPLVPQGLDSLAADDVDEEAEERYLAAILDKTPPGFSWEYRAARTSIVEGEGDYYSDWWPNRDHGVVVAMVDQWRARDGRSWFDSRLERRPVGPAERVED